MDYVGRNILYVGALNLLVTSKCVVQDGDVLYLENGIEIKTSDVCN